MASLMTSFWFWLVYQSSFNHKWHSFLPLQNISQKAKIIDSLLASLLGLSAESSSTSSVTVTWDPMQSLRNGDTVEYLLQAQCVGKDLDFRQVCWVRSHVRMDIYLLASYSRLLSYCFAHVIEQNSWVPSSANMQRMLRRRRDNCECKFYSIISGWSTNCIYFLDSTLNSWLPFSERHSWSCCLFFFNEMILKTLGF